MKFLITGATGLIGSALIDNLLKNAHTVNFLTTRKEKLLTKTNFKGFLWNPTKGEIDESCIEGVDVIVHLAGASINKPWTKNYKEILLNSRTQASKLLYNCIEKNPTNQVKYILCASAIGIYPNHSTILFTEEWNPNPVSFMERLVTKWEEENKKLIRLVPQGCLMRIGLVLSTKGGILSTLLQSMQTRLAIYFGNGRQWQSWIHIDDIVALFSKAIDNKWTGIFNAVSPTPVTQKTLMKTIARKLKNPSLLLSFPSFIFKVILGERSALVLNSQKVSAQKSLQKGYTFRYPTIEEAILSFKKK